MPFSTPFFIVAFVVSACVKPVTVNLPVKMVVTLVLAPAPATAVVVLPVPVVVVAPVPVVVVGAAVTVVAFFVGASMLATVTLTVKFCFEKLAVKLDCNAAGCRFVAVFTTALTLMELVDGIVAV